MAVRAACTGMPPPRRPRTVPQERLYGSRWCNSTRHHHNRVVWRTNCRRCSSNRWSRHRNTTMRFDPRRRIGRHHKARCSPSYLVGDATGSNASPTSETHTPRQVQSTQTKQTYHPSNTCGGRGGETPEHTHTHTRSHTAQPTTVVGTHFVIDHHTVPLCTCSSTNWSQRGSSNRQGTCSSTSQTSRPCHRSGQRCSWPCSWTGWWSYRTCQRGTGCGWKHPWRSSNPCHTVHVGRSGAHIPEHTQSARATTTNTA